MTMSAIAAARAMAASDHQLRRATAGAGQRRATTLLAAAAASAILLPHSAAFSCCRAAAAVPAAAAAVASSSSSLVALSPSGLASCASSRWFSSKSPRRRVELHPSQAGRTASRNDQQEKSPKAKVKPKEVVLQAVVAEQDQPLQEDANRTITVEADLVSSTAVPYATSGPTTKDAQGRHEIRTKLHPDGAIVGRGRVVANFGTRMLVQEVPWEEEGAAASTDDTEGSQQPGANVVVSKPAGASAATTPGALEEGARFICTPRGKLGKIVCGDTVLWEWSSNHADSSAFIVEVLPRTTQFERVDKGRHGGQVLLASNFHHMCIVCAAQPATNGMLLDRYLAAAQRMGVTASIIFNKTDLPEAKAFKTDMEDLRAIGIPVIETSCTKGKRKGIEALRIHLAKIGPNGTPGIAIFVGQSGSGKSSLLNALSPSLQLAVNELSRNHQGRHTTTQTIMHQLETGGEIIDSPGFQNYIPPTIPAREIAQGFVEFKEPAQYCHYGSRCLHVNEPDCGVRLAVRGSVDDMSAALEKARLAEETPLPGANGRTLDQRAVVAAAFQNSLLQGASGVGHGLIPDDPDSPSADAPARESAGEKQRKRAREARPRRARQAEVDEVAVENQQLKLHVLEQAPAPTRDEEEFARALESTVVDGAKHHHSARTLEITQAMLGRGLLDRISKRRYESYIALVSQQQELEKKKY